MSNLGQNENYAVENIERIQNKAIIIPNFKGPCAEVSNLYKESKIYTLKQKTTIKNSQFVYDQLKKNLHNSLNNYFIVKKNQHQHNKKRKKQMFQL